VFDVAAAGFDAAGFDAAGFDLTLLTAAPRRRRTA
jgi:hypothetical protein